MSYVGVLRNSSAWNYSLLFDCSTYTGLDLVTLPQLSAQVVFGHCISDCGGTGSNINAAQAVQVTSDLKESDGGAFACNGGAFFWVALHDAGGAWSDAVVAEVSKTAGCSAEGNVTTTQATGTTGATATTTTTTSATTTVGPDEPSPATTTTFATTTTSTTTTAGPDEPPLTTTTSVTQAPPSTTTLATSTTTTSNELVVDSQPRCGTSELDAREHCKNTCVHSGDCQSGEHCYGVHQNCKPRVYIS